MLTASIVNKKKFDSTTYLTLQISASIGVEPTEMLLTATVLVDDFFDRLSLTNDNLVWSVFLLASPLRRGISLVLIC